MREVDFLSQIAIMIIEARRSISPKPRKNPGMTIVMTTLDAEEESKIQKTGKSR
ncbi:MAG: hypothetical protein ACE5K3_03140 [bacterium]